MKNACVGVLSIIELSIAFHL